MDPAQKIRSVLRGLLQRHGTETVKRWLWDGEYWRGKWNCLDTMPNDYVYPHVERHAHGGSILDLGCGPGTVGSELQNNTYRSYTGVDISNLAIEKARSKALAVRRYDKNKYIQADIATYVPDQQYNVILFGDSIGYFAQQRILQVLQRYSNYLSPNGVFIVRNWLLRKRQRMVLRNIEDNFEVVEKQLYHESQLFVIAFRPLTQRRFSSKS